MATTPSKPARVTRRTVLTCALATPAVMAGNVVVADIVDMSFAKAAATELGPYKGRSG
jgi:hypothetical protein